MFVMKNLKKLTQAQILAMMKYYTKMSTSLYFFHKRPKFGTCEGVFFLVKLRSEVAIQTFQKKL